MKRTLSLLLVVAMFATLGIPAYALNPDIEDESIVTMSAETTLSSTEPSVPDGFTFWYSIDEDIDAEARLIDGMVVVSAFIPHVGLTASIIGAIRFVEAWLRDPNIQGETTDYVYQADNPIADYGVPYVYWHKVKVKYLTNGVLETRWTSYYEYAVAPR